MQSECQILWDKCLEIIKDNLPEELFTTWFLPIRPYSFNEKKEFRILVPSNFFGEYIEAHFQKLLIPVVQRVMGPDVSLIYRVATYGDIKDEGAMMDCRPEIQARPTPIRQNAPTEFEQKRRIQDCFREITIGHVVCPLSLSLETTGNSVVPHSFFLESHFCQFRIADHQVTEYQSHLHYVLPTFVFLLA